MASLTKCLRQAGPHVSEDDKSFIRASVEEYRADGVPPSEAALKAVSEAVNLAIADYNELTDRIAKKGVRLEHKPLYELPETMAEVETEKGEAITQKNAEEEEKLNQYQERKRAEKKAAAKPKETTIKNPKYKEGVIDVEATTNELPPVPEGHTRLYRASSPTVAFEDVFDAEKLKGLKAKNLPGVFFTNDLSYADYFRETYGKDATLSYIDVPTENIAGLEANEGEYVVEVEPAPKITEGTTKGGTKVKVKKRRTIVNHLVNMAQVTFSKKLNPAGLSSEVIAARAHPSVRNLFKNLVRLSAGEANPYTYTKIEPGEESSVVQEATTADQIMDSLIDLLHTDDPWRKLLISIKTTDIAPEGIQVMLVSEYFMPDSSGRYSHQARVSPGLDEDNEWVYLYDGPNRQILLNENILDDRVTTDTIAYIFLHELVHAATYHSVHADNDIAMRLDSIRKEVINYLSNKYGETEYQLIQNIYGLTDVHEFMAEGFTNAKFQQLLASIPVKGQPAFGLVTNLWRAFVDTVRKSLNIGQNEFTVLDEVMVLGDMMLTPFEEINDDIEIERSSEWLGDYREAEEVKFKGARAREKRQVNNAVDMKLPGSATLTSALSNNDNKTLKEMNGKLRDGGNRAFEFLLGFLTNDTIETEFGRDFENRHVVKNKDGTISRTNPLTDYINAKQSEQAEAKKFERAAELMHNAWRRLEKKYAAATGKAQEQWDRFNDLIHDSTMFEVHPDKPWDHPDNRITRENNRTKKTGKIAHARLRLEYMKLPGDLKAMYQQAKKFYSDTSEKMRVQAIHSIADMYDLTDPTLRRILTRATKLDQLLAVNPPVKNWENIARMIAKINDNMVANGPYFPLNRYGDYALSYEATELYSGYSSKEKAYAAAQEAAAQEPGAKRTPPIKGKNGWQFMIKVPGFKLYESLSEAEADRAAMKEAGVRVGEVTRKLEMKLPNDSLPGQIMAIAERKMQGPGAERSKMVMREALIHMLPDTSIRKRFLRRKNIAGGSKNNRRSFASYVQSAGWHLASMKFRKKVDTAFASLVDAGKGKTDSNVSIRMSQVVNEMIKRHNKASAKSGKVGRGVAKFGFLNFLMSASYSVINATQPYTMTLPYLGGRYGTARATRAMGRAYRMVTGQIGKTIWEAKGGLAALNWVSGEFDLNVATEQVIETVNKTDPEAAQMLRVLADRGIIDATFSLEVSEAARSGKRGPIDQLVEVGRVMPFAVEILNRATTAIATYELAREKGASVEAATELAREAVVKTQFDYSELNRPRFFTKNDLLRAMTMFKIHPLGVYSFIAHNVRKSMGKNATVEERRQGAKTLGLLLLTHGSLAGAAGSILMEPIRLMLTMLASIFDIEDDDEWIGWMAAPEVAIRQMLYEVTGSPEVSEILTHGLPRAVGIDISTRVGLQNMMVQWTKGQHPIRDTVVNSIMGPLLGSASSFSRGMDYLANGGDLLRGLEYFMPKAVRDVTRTYRYATTGMTDWNGNVIATPEQFTGTELAARFLGLGTSTESETYMGRQYIQGKKTRAANERKAFMNRYDRAETAAERQAIWEEVQAYNESLPKDMWRAYRITRSQLIRSLHSRTRTEREMEKGTHFSRRERQMKERLDFLNP